jgi:hypothetical protein
MSMPMHSLVATMTTALARATVGHGLGIAAVVLLLVAWSEGFGILGGRPANLAARLRDNRDRERDPEAGATAPSVEAAGSTPPSRRRAPTRGRAPNVLDPDQPEPPPHPNGAPS